MTTSSTDVVKAPNLKSIGGSNYTNNAILAVPSRFDWWRDMKMEGRQKWTAESQEEALEMCLRALTPRKSKDVLGVLRPRTANDIPYHWYPRIGFWDEIMTFLLTTELWMIRWPDNKQGFIDEIAKRSSRYKQVVVRFVAPAFSREEMNGILSDYYVRGLNDEQHWTEAVISCQITILRNWFTTLELLCEMEPIGKVEVRPVLDRSGRELQSAVDFISDLATFSNHNNLKDLWPLIAEAAADRAKATLMQQEEPVSSQSTRYSSVRLERPALRREDIHTALRRRVGPRRDPVSTPRPPSPSTPVQDIDETIGALIDSAEAGPPPPAQTAGANSPSNSENNGGDIPRIQEEDFSAMSASIQQTKTHTLKAFETLVDHSERISRMELSHSDLKTKYEKLNNSDSSNGMAKMRSSYKDLLAKHNQLQSDSSNGMAKMRSSYNDLLAKHEKLISDSSNGMAKMRSSYDDLLAKHNQLHNEFQNLTRSLAQGLRGISSGAENGKGNGEHPARKGREPEVASETRATDDDILRAIDQLGSKKRSVEDEDIYGASPAPSRKKRRSQ